MVVANIPIKGSRMKFFTILIADDEAYYAEFEWVCNDVVESWVEASSCLCERVFSFVIAQSQST